MNRFNKFLCSIGFHSWSEWKDGFWHEDKISNLSKASEPCKIRHCKRHCSVVERKSVSFLKYERYSPNLGWHNLSNLEFFITILRSKLH